jgi:hypothetical protein
MSVTTPHASRSLLLSTKTTAGTLLHLLRLRPLAPQLHEAQLPLALSSHALGAAACRAALTARRQAPAASSPRTRRAPDCVTAPTWSRLSHAIVSSSAMTLSIFSAVVSCSCRVCRLIIPLQLAAAIPPGRTPIAI